MKDILYPKKKKYPNNSSFEEINSALCSYEFMNNILVLKSLLEELKILSTKLQTSDINLIQAHQQIILSSSVIKQKHFYLKKIKEKIFINKRYKGFQLINNRFTKEIREEEFFEEIGNRILERSLKSQSRKDDSSSEKKKVKLNI